MDGEAKYSLVIITLRFNLQSIGILSLSSTSGKAAISTEFVSLQY